MPRYNGERPRMSPADEWRLVKGEMAEELIAPAGAVRRKKRFRPQPWRWRLLAFMLLPREVWLVVGAPVEAQGEVVSRRLHRRVGLELFNEPAPPRDEDWARLLKKGPAHLWDAELQKYPRYLDAERLLPMVWCLHRLPTREGYGWHPQQWWWSSYREYVSPNPVVREGVPRVTPLRPDPRRPWADDHFQPSLLTPDELARTWRARCYARARRWRPTDDGEEGAKKRKRRRQVDVSREWLESRWGTAILGPRDRLDKLAWHGGA